MLVGMKTIESIHLLEDESTMSAMVRGSVFVLAGGAALGALWVIAAAAGLPLPMPELFGLSMALMAVWFFSAFVAHVLTLPVHELVHAACFKLLGPRGTRVRLGAKLDEGVLFAQATGAVLTRRRYMVVLLAPCVVLSAAHAIAGAVLGWPFWALAQIVLHVAGCTGDLLMAREIAANRDVRWCRDTAYGADLLA